MRAPLLSGTDVSRATPGTIGTLTATECAGKRSRVRCLDARSSA
jgi:hypothetical protein